MTINRIDPSAITSIMTIQINSAILSAIEKKPNSKILNLESLSLDVIKAYIRAKGSSEWARRSVANDKSLEETANWFKAEIDKLYAFMCLYQER